MTNEGPRQYFVSGLDPAMTYDIAIRDAADATLDDTGDVSFADANDDLLADGVRDTVAHIELVNGTSTYDLRMATLSIYPPPGDERVRFLLADGAAYKALAWMKILPDGSLVFSPATGKGGPGFAKAGMAESTERGPRVSYAGGEVVTDPRERRELHVTYHASGIVNAGTRRSFAAPLRELDGPIQLFQAVFRHPSAAPEVVEPRKWDALLLEEPGTAFAVDDERPLVGRVLAAPQGQLQVSTDGYSTTLVMPFPGAEDCPPLDFGFEFAYANAGPWPPYSYVVWAAERSD